VRGIHVRHVRQNVSLRCELVIVVEVSRTQP
jgi:hypothetical protein